MRWFWIDRYLEFESGRRAVAVKNVSLAEDHLHDHFPGVPVMPNSLIVEGMAQTAGLLVAESSGFVRRVVLAKISRVRFHFVATPGDTLIYRAEVDEIKNDGALVTTTSHIGGRIQSEAEIFFAHLGGRLSDQELFSPADLLAWLRLLHVFEVGKAADGSPLQVPPLLAETDRNGGG